MVSSIEELYSLFKKCNGISTDSRKVGQGSMFFALKGDKFDGNDYALDALKAGAKIAVVDRVSLEGASFRNRRCVVVENVLSTFQKLASFHRQQFDIPVIAITGTNGKTTSKELVAAVLSQKYQVCATEANYNNFIGVPITLMRITSKTQIAVVEMGASAPGEIALLANIVKPTFGLVTNVGKAHLQGFGSFAGVKKAKGELYDYLRQNGGVAFYNSDNADISSMIEMRHGLSVRPFGATLQKARLVPPSFDNPYLAINLTLDNYQTTFSTKLVGAYNLDNVLAALCIGKNFDIPVPKAIHAIEDYIPTNNRSQFVRTDRNLLIVDAYNANPASMAASLSNFGSIEFPDKTLILGDMLELGKDSPAEHKAVFEAACRISDSIFLVGEEFSKIYSGYAGEYPTVKSFADAESLKLYLADNPLQGRTILVKGSNGTHLQAMKDVL